jgi:hypothetical protein
MAFSTQRVTSDGTLSSLALSIDYFDRDEISVFFDDIVDALPWAWVGLTEKTISFSPDVPNGVEVLVRRTTPLDEVFHDFDGGAAFVATTVDENFKQVLHIAQEAVEGGTVGDFFNNLNMHGYKITNLGNPVDPGDAVNLSRFTLQENLVITYRNQTIVYRDQAEAFALAAEASASSVDTDTLLNRVNHTGTQAISTVTGLQTALDTTVKLSGAQTIADVKTFSNSPIVPNPTTNFQACTKAYADTVATALTAPGTIAPTLFVEHGSQASTSGTAINFTGIPTWAKEVTMVLAGVSTTGTSRLQLQVGDTGSGSYLITGYNSHSSGIVTAGAQGTVASTDAINLYTASAAAAVWSGEITLRRVSAASGIWQYSGVLNRTDNVGMYFVNGTVQISGSLDKVRLTPAGADSFDAGLINVTWR